MVCGFKVLHLPDISTSSPKGSAFRVVAAGPFLGILSAHCTRSYHNGRSKSRGEAQGCERDGIASVQLTKLTFIVQAATKEESRWQGFCKNAQIRRQGRGAKRDRVEVLFLLQGGF
jgi:hypothetical protein